ncbi:MAG: MarR family winged helix-turn-helix transcriptional regulator [Corynebacterium matruchotii]
MMAAKTEALRGFGLTVAQYAAMLSLYYVPEQSSAQLARAAAVTPQTMATVIAKLEQKRLVTNQADGFPAPGFLGPGYNHWWMRPGWPGLCWTPQ